jgi:hypothetical protein
MASLGTVINREDLPEDSSGDYSPLPEGWYTTQITGAELKDTKSGTGKYIKVEHTVVGEQFSGRKVWGMINIQNPNEKAEEIGRQQLNKMMTAVGLAKLEDTDELVGLDVSIKLKIKEAANGYDASNEVKGYKAMGSAPAGASAPKAESSAPPWAGKK